MEKLFLHLFGNLSVCGKVISALFNTEDNHVSLRVACGNDKYLITVYKMEEKENA